MSDIAAEAARILAWDPDFTKTTPEEAAQIATAEAGEFIADSDIDWNNLSKYVE